MCHHAETSLWPVVEMGEMAAAAVPTAQAARAIPSCCRTLDSAVLVRRLNTKTVALARPVVTLFQRSMGHPAQTVVQARLVRLASRDIIPTLPQEVRAGRVRVAAEVLVPLACPGPVALVKFMRERFPKWANTGPTAPTAWQAKTASMVPLGPMAQTSVAALYLPLGPGGQGAVEGKAAAAAVPAAQGVEAVVVEAASH
jgi:hypothetical protein